MRRASPGRRTGWRAAALVTAIGLALISGQVGAADLGSYHSYEELTAALKALASKHPNLARLDSMQTPAAVESGY